jgi:hypothetical protein
MPYIVSILLPAHSPSPAALFERVRSELVDAFGGVTMHLNSPAEGLWRDHGTTEHDRMVTVEVLTDELDRTWWLAYRRQLEARFEQKEIMVRATPTERI